MVTKSLCVCLSVINRVTATRFSQKRRVWHRSKLQTATSNVRLQRPWIKPHLHHRINRLWVSCPTLKNVVFDLSDHFLCGLMTVRNSSNSRCHYPCRGGISVMGQNLWLSHTHTHIEKNQIFENFKKSQKSQKSQKFQKISKISKISKNFMFDMFPK